MNTFHVKRNDFETNYSNIQFFGFQVLATWIQMSSNSIY